ncbi:MAG: argininosuccinate lyase [Fluviicola sp.]
MKLWDKGFKIDEFVEKFTVGNDRVTDLHLIKYDLLGNRAHATMLEKIGILTPDELKEILICLSDIEKDWHDGNFNLDENVEDIHSKIEFELTKRIGEAGKKIHTARSRNDQVLVDLHMYIKYEINEIKQFVLAVFNRLQLLSEEYKDVLMPGYTHLQVAMPSSFGLWFGAYAETLIDDVILLNAAYKVSDQNPLGSAAGYGTSFPIDRNLTTKLLGFSTLKYNVVAAQMSRGKLEKHLAFGLSSLAGTISKFSSDVCLFLSQNFNFISFPKELLTGSSIMPHKQNPDVFELLRAKSNKIQQLPFEIQLILTNLTSGYHRDYQLLKEPIIQAIETTKENLKMLEFMLEFIQINPSILENPIYDYLYTVEELNRMVMDGFSFREAYQKLGKDIVENKYSPVKKVSHTHEGSIGNLCTAEIQQKMKAVF